MDAEKRLTLLLADKKLSLAAAESCTAGYFSYLLTKTPGSSKVFSGSVVIYSLRSKNYLFKIPRALLAKTKGVSPEIAGRLAAGIKRMFHADIGTAVVGFAGPGARKGIKTGTAFLAVDFRQNMSVKRMVINGSRDTVRKKASQALITMTYNIVKESDKRQE